MPYDNIIEDLEELKRELDQDYKLCVWREEKVGRHSGDYFQGVHSTNMVFQATIFHYQVLVQIMLGRERDYKMVNKLRKESYGKNNPHGTVDQTTEE